MMTAEEAENAFTVSAESGASWTLTLAGSNFAAAVSAEVLAQQSLDDAVIGLNSAQDLQYSGHRPSLTRYRHTQTRVGAVIAAQDGRGWCGTMPNLRRYRHTPMLRQRWPPLRRTRLVAAQAESDAIQAHADAEEALAAAQADEAAAAQRLAIQAHDDAQGAVSTAQSVDARLDQDVVDPDLYIEYEQAGLDTWQTALDNAQAVLTAAEAAVAAAQSAYDAGVATATTQFLTSYPDPADLTAGTSTVEGSPIAVGTLNLAVGAIWTQSDIDALQDAMDGFVDGFPLDNDATVDDLSSDLADAHPRWLPRNQL